MRDPESSHVKIFHTLLFVLAALLAGCGTAGEDDGRPVVDPTSIVSPEAAAYLIRGQERFDAGDPGRALALLDSAEQRVTPDRAAFLADLFFLRGRIQSSINRNELARESYERVLDLRPDYQGAHANLGNLSYRDGQYREAIRHYRLEQDAYPSAARLVLIGRSYVKVGVVDSARMAYEEAIEMDDRQAEAYIRLAELYDENGEPEEALAYGLKAVEYDPENMDYATLTGTLWMRAGDPERAIPLFERVLERQPFRQEAIYNLGQSLARVGRRGEATPYLAAADSLLRVERELAQWETLTIVEPENPAAWATYGYALRHLGRDEEALRAYGASLHLDPENNDVRMEIANLLLKARDYTRALEEYSTILERDPGKADAWVNLGITLARTGESDAARVAWEKALQVDPDQPQVKTYLARLSDPSR